MFEVKKKKRKEKNSKKKRTEEERKSMETEKATFSFTETSMATIRVELALDRGGLQPERFEMRQEMGRGTVVWVTFTTI